MGEESSVVNGELPGGDPDGQMGPGWVLLLQAVLRCEEVKVGEEEGCEV